MFTLTVSKTKIKDIFRFRVCLHSLRIAFNGSFTLTDRDSGTESDSDSKPDGYIVLCRTFHIAQTRTRIPTPYFSIGQESESEPVAESISGHVNEP